MISPTMLLAIAAGLGSTSSPFEGNGDKHSSETVKNGLYTKGEKKDSVKGKGAPPTKRKGTRKQRKQRRQS